MQCSISKIWGIFMLVSKISAVTPSISLKSSSDIPLVAARSIHFCKVPVTLEKSLRNSLNSSVLLIFSVCVITVTSSSDFGAVSFSTSTILIAGTLYIRSFEISLSLIMLFLAIISWSDEV